jgi:hypothetical protein
MQELPHRKGRLALADHQHIDIVFDGPPGPESGCFIEVEDAQGRSIRFGQWVKREDGYWALRITPGDFQKRRVLDVGAVSDALKRVADRVKREGPGDGRYRPAPRHASDCAVHDAPAYEAGACTCGVDPTVPK